VGCSVKPLEAPIRKGHANFLGLHLFARKEAHDWGVFPGKWPPLPVLKQITAAPLQPGDTVQILGHAQHFESGLIGEDKSSFTINDGKRYAHIVENRLKQSLWLKA
jgi:hypothetical protein